MVWTSFSLQVVPARGDSFSPNELFVGSLILHNLQTLQFNAHEVYEMLRGSRSDIKPWKHSPIGLAIYPIASNFNHSCHAGVARLRRIISLVGFRGLKRHNTLLLEGRTKQTLKILEVKQGRINSNQQV